MKGKRHASPQASCRRVTLAVLLPFALAAVTVLALLRRGDPADSSTLRYHQTRGVLESRSAGPGCSGAGCAQASSAIADGGELVDPSVGFLAADPDGDASEGLEPLFLFIGILSGRGYRHRRLAVREAWANRAQTKGLVASRFVLSEDERTPQVHKEVATYNDIIFLKEKTNYKSILYKTFHVLEYAVRTYDVKFVLKTDDDAFVNVPPLIAQLHALCEDAECRNERVYLGCMARNSEVLLSPGHKWNNAAFFNHTGLRTYPNYMMGGGYVLGGEVARILVDTHRRMRLKFTPIEDANVGFWLMSMDLRHVDHPKVYTWAAPCCFEAPVRHSGRRVVTRFRLLPEFERDICSADPWLILHKIDSPTKMRYVGAKAANCTTPVTGLADSIEQYLPAPARERLLRARAAAKAVEDETLKARVAASIDSTTAMATARAAAAAQGQAQALAQAQSREQALARSEERKREQQGGVAAEQEEKKESAAGKDGESDGDAAAGRADAEVDGAAETAGGEAGKEGTAGDAADTAASAGTGAEETKSTRR